MIAARQTRAGTGGAGLDPRPSMAAGIEQDVRRAVPVAAYDKRAAEVLHGHERTRSGNLGAMHQHGWSTDKNPVELGPVPIRRPVPVNANPAVCIGQLEFLIFKVLQSPIENPELLFAIHPPVLSVR